MQFSKNKKFGVRLFMGLIVMSNIAMPSHFAHAEDSALPATYYVTPSHETQFRNLVRDTNSDSVLRDWQYSYDGAMVRHRTDLAVSNIIENDPDAQKVLAEVLRELDAITDDSVLAQNASSFRHSKGHDQNYRARQILQQAAMGHNFSKDAIDDAILWTSIGTINAYTFSAIHERLLVVVYQELLTMMNEKELLAVFAHELGHIHMKHVLTGIVVQSLFDAIGKNLIPEEQRGTYLAVVAKESRSLMQKAIDFEGPIADKITDVLLAHGSRVGDRLYQSLGADRLMKLANSVNIAMGGEKITMGQSKAFKADMTMLTRSQEITADRWAVLVAGMKALADSMSRLAGGEHNSGELLIKQSREFLADMNERRVDPRTIEQGDHPQTPLRAAQVVSFTETSNYKIMSDDFIKSMDIQLKLQAEIQAEKDILNQNSRELIANDRIAFRMNSLKSYSSKLRTAITAQLMKEFLAANDAKADLNHIEKMIKYLNELISPSVVLPGAEHAVTTSFLIPSTSLDGPIPKMRSSGSFLYDFASQLSDFVKANPQDPRAKLASSLMSEIKISMPKYDSNPLTTMDRIRGALPAVTCHSLFE